MRFAKRTSRVIGIFLRALAAVAAFSGGATFVEAQSLTLPVYRFLNTVTGVHFYTASEAEKNSILATNPALALEGIAFYAFGSAASDRTPVYRFLNTGRGVHFYTASEAEKNSILATNPALALEGISYYAMPTAGTGLVPLYRFLNTVTGVHFYTASEAEKNSIVANTPSLVLEGIAYYVRSEPGPPTQFPIASAWSAYQQSAHNYNLTAKDAKGNSYTAQLNVTPGANGTFGGKAVSSSSSSTIMKMNGATLDVSSFTDYFVSSPYTFVASLPSEGGCDLGRNQQALPSYATVGQSGAFYAYDTFYLSECVLYLRSRTTVVWSLKADSPTTAWFCLLFSTLGTVVGSTTETGTECHKVDQSGNVSALTIDFTVGGVLMTFQ